MSANKWDPELGINCERGRPLTEDEERATFPQGVVGYCNDTIPDPLAPAHSASGDSLVCRRHRGHGGPHRAYGFTFKRHEWGDE